jgi:hyperosmotically inducible periplasmic protein
MRTLLVLLIGIAVGIAVVLYWRKSGTDDLRARAEAKAGEVKATLNQKIVDIRPEDVKEELARTGRVVRKGAERVGAAVADATADARVTAAIKGKYAVDSDLSALKISVNTTGSVVTLSGTVASADLVSKAMRLALETEGVTEVISTLQVKP